MDIPFRVGCAVNRIEENSHTHRLRMAQENEMDVLQLVAPSSSAMRAARLHCEYSHCLSSEFFVFLCPFALYNAVFCIASAVVSSAHDLLGCTHIVDYAVS